LGALVDGGIVNEGARTGSIEQKRQLARLDSPFGANRRAEDEVLGRGAF